MRGILTYHSIDSSRSPVSIDASAFRRHVDWLASGAVRVVPLSELVKLGDGQHALALTFDDAYANLAETAWPLLRERGLPATVFVPTGRVGRDNSWGEQVERGIPTLPLCSWDALGRMAAEGLEIGSHGVNHVRLAGLDAELARAELQLSAETLAERLGRAPRSFCYPYGSCDTRAAALAGEVYELAVTTELRPLAPNDSYLRLPRLDAWYYRGNRRLESFGAPAFQRHLWLRASARRVRARLSGA